MSLCRPTRCGCAIRSGSLYVTETGGIFDIETYEGVATEVPDTRPTGADRFNGMRVWTTDTQRLFVWNASLGQWRILHEPPQVWNMTSFTQGVTITAVTTTGWYQRSLGVFRGTILVAASSAGTSGSRIEVPLPLTLADPNSIGGSFMFTDLGNTNYLGYPANLGTTQIGLIVDREPTYLGQFPSFGVASGDVIRLTVQGPYA